MAIIKSKPTTFLPDFISDFFDNSIFPESILNPTWMSKGLTRNIPSANIKETAKDYSIELAAPGLEKGDFKIDIENDVLSISAEKKHEEKEETEKFTRHEFEYNAFNRSFRLPESVNIDKVDAKYENGLLHLTIQKKPESISSLKKEIKLK
jgi:HSP20 family protein